MEDATLAALRTASSAMFDIGQANRTVGEIYHRVVRAS